MKRHIGIYVLFYLIVSCAALQGPMEDNQKDEYYTVTFLNYDGSVYKKISVRGNTYIEPIQPPPTHPNSGEYEFYMWYLDPSLTKPWDYINKPITSDITLYPKFVLKPYNINVIDYTSTSIKIQWDHSSFIPGTTSHKIYIGTSPATLQEITTTTNTTYNITGLTRSQKYFIKIDSSNGTLSQIIEFTPQYRWRLVRNAEWSARYGHRITIEGTTRLWLSGGRDQIGLKNDIWYSTNGENWTQVTTQSGSVPSARNIHGFVYFNSKLYIFGGQDDSQPLSTCRNATPNTTSLNWTTCNFFDSNGRAYFAYAVLGNEIVTYGGYNNAAGGTNKNDICKMDISGNWSCPYQNLSPKYGSSSAVSGSNIYFFGGYDDNNFYKESFYTNFNTWSQITSNMPWTNGRACHQSIYHDGKIWIIGGWDGGTNYYNDVYYTDNNGIGWIKVENYPGFPMWSPRSDFQLAVWNGKLYLYGGSKSDNTYSNEIWVME